MKEAILCIKGGKEFPYHNKPPKDKAEEAALGILYDLSDRGGIKWELEKVEGDIRDDIVDAIADIIRALFPKRQED